jgi:hypothetical protein
MRAELSHRFVSGALAVGLVLGGLGISGCASAPPKPLASAGEMALPDPNAPQSNRERDDDHPLAPRAAVDTTACSPAGKSVVIAARDRSGKPSRWRYLTTIHGRRSLACEAVDTNGDGKIDARYFYDKAGRLVLEQRDLDFDGRAEVVADYSQFRRPGLVSARHRQ